MSKPTSPPDFVGKTNIIARALFGKMPKVKSDPKLEPIDRCWLFTGVPGCGKTSLALALSGLAGNPIDVEQINGQSCSVEVVRKWEEAGWYRPMGDIRFQIVDEIDGASIAACNQLRSYLDHLPQRTVFIGTTNRPLKQLQEQLQSRFKAYFFDPIPTESIAKLLVQQFGISPSVAEEQAAGAEGNVRAARASVLSYLEVVEALA